MKLKKLLKDLVIITIKNDQNDLEIENIAYDSRLLRAGGLFVAIAGFVTDGHGYVSKAIANGAVAIVHEKDLDTYQEGVVYIKVANSRYALGTVASAFYQNPSAEMMISGVTGTNGKTTLTHMLKHVFETAQKKSGLIGTIHNIIDDQIIDNKGRTTPESLDMQEIIRRMTRAACTHLFMEVSSQALDLDRLNSVSFDYGIFTNLTQDHLDYHKNFDTYFEAKAKLFSQINKAAIINGDDPWGQVLLARLREKNHVKVISYGMEAGNDYYAKDLKMTVTGSHFTLVTPVGEESFFTNLPGEFMVANAIAAIINGTEEGIPMALLKKAVATFPGIEGRMDILETKAPFGVVIDYAHSPDSLEKLLLSMRKIYPGKIVLVFGCDGDRDKEKRPIMGRIAGELADFVVVTSINPASEDPLTIMKAVAQGVGEKTNDYQLEVIRQEAIYLGARLCRPGGVLILAGKGHEKYEILKDGIVPYNEWEVARQALQRLGFK